jgi:hypothetical protein
MWQEKEKLCSCRGFTHGCPTAVLSPTSVLTKASFNKVLPSLFSQNFQAIACLEFLCPKFHINFLFPTDMI